MTYRSALFWNRTPRTPVARLTMEALRRLLYELAAEGDHPEPAIHCDLAVNARDASIRRHSLAHLAKAIAATDTAIQIIEEAQFTRSKIRILECPITGAPLLAVSPVIDHDMPQAYLAKLTASAHALDTWADGRAGACYISDIADTLGRGPALMVRHFADEVMSLEQDMAPFHTTPRRIMLRWQSEDHAPAPTMPMTYPASLVKNQFNLDPATGRLFATLDHDRHLVDACIAGSADKPHVWDRVLGIGANGYTTQIGTVAKTDLFTISLPFRNGDQQLTTQYFHDEANPQPAVRLAAPVTA